MPEHEVEFSRRSIIPAPERLARIADAFMVGLEALMAGFGSEARTILDTTDFEWSDFNGPVKAASKARFARFKC